MQTVLEWRVQTWGMETSGRISPLWSTVAHFIHFISFVSYSLTRSEPENTKFQALNNNNTEKNKPWVYVCPEERRFPQVCMILAGGAAQSWENTSEHVWRGNTEAQCKSGVQNLLVSPSAPRTLHSGAAVVVFKCHDLCIKSLFSLHSPTFMAPQLNKEPALGWWFHTGTSNGINFIYFKYIYYKLIGLHSLLMASGSAVVNLQNTITGLSLVPLQ